MIRNVFKGSCLLLLICFIASCKRPVKEQTDQVYSRHLQRHVKLSIISTGMQGENSDMNLLLFNNGNILKAINARAIIDSLYEKELIQPLLLVAIHGNEKEDYGLGTLSASIPEPGKKADKYGQFVINELFPFIKKKTNTRKFRSTAIWGNSLSGISAFDIAWQHADKIDRVGIFAGDFNYAGSAFENNQLINPVFREISASRKRPQLKYWIYAGKNADTVISKNSGTFIDIILKKNTGSVADIQFIADNKGDNSLASYHHQFAVFLVWALGK